MSDFKACVPKNIGHYFSNLECTQKTLVVFLKLCLQFTKIH